MLACYWARLPTRWMLGAGVALALSSCVLGTQSAVSRWRSTTAGVLQDSVVHTGSGFGWRVPSSNQGYQLYMATFAAEAIYPFIDSNDRTEVGRELALALTTHGAKGSPGIGPLYVVDRVLRSNSLYKFVNAEQITELAVTADKAFDAPGINDIDPTIRSTDALIYTRAVREMLAVGAPAQLQERLSKWNAANPVNCAAISPGSNDSDFLDAVLLGFSGACDQAMFASKFHEIIADVSAATSAVKITADTCFGLWEASVLASAGQQAAVRSEAERLITLYQLRRSSDPIECAYVFGTMVQADPAIEARPDPELVAFARVVADTGQLPTFVALQDDDLAALLLAAAELHSSLGGITAQVESSPGAAVALARTLMGRGDAFVPHAFAKSGSPLVRTLTGRVLMSRSDICSDVAAVESAGSVVAAAGTDLPPDLQQLAAPLAVRRQCGQDDSNVRAAVVVEARRRITETVVSPDAIPTLWDAARAECDVGSKPTISASAVFGALEVAAAVDTHGGAFDATGRLSPQLTYELADLMTASSWRCTS